MWLLPLRMLEVRANASLISAIAWMSSCKFAAPFFDTVS